MTAAIPLSALQNNSISARPQLLQTGNALAPDSVASMYIGKTVLLMPLVPLLNI